MKFIVIDGKHLGDTVPEVNYKCGRDPPLR